MGDDKTKKSERRPLVSWQDYRHVFCVKNRPSKDPLVLPHFLPPSSLRQRFPLQALVTCPSLFRRGPSSTADPINTCKIWGLGLCVIVSGVNLLWHLLGAKLRPHVLLLRLPFRHGRAWLGMPSSSPPAYDALLPLTALGTAFIESKRAKANSQPYLTIYLIVNNARAP